MKKLMINLLALTAICSAILTFIVGCGSEKDAIPTTLQADPKTGEVSVKGEKGDRGEQGPAGPAGKDGKDGQDGAQGAAGPKGDAGATGAAGKDGQDEIQGLWKDTLSGKSWVYIQGKFRYNEVVSLCSPWRLPTNTELATAVRHGLARILTIPSPAATEHAWTSELQGVNRYGVTLLASDETLLGASGVLNQTDYWRVYCVKPE